MMPQSAPVPAGRGSYAAPPNTFPLNFAFSCTRPAKPLRMLLKFAIPQTPPRVSLVANASPLLADVTAAPANAAAPSQDEDTSRIRSLVAIDVMSKPVGAWPAVVSTAWQATAPRFTNKLFMTWPAKPRRYCTPLVAGATKAGGFGFAPPSVTPPMPV